MKPSDRLRITVSDCYNHNLVQFGQLAPGVPVSEGAQGRLLALAIEEATGQLLDEFFVSPALVVEPGDGLAQQTGVIDTTKPIACSERMPPPGARVLFYVPGQENADMRWKAGYQLPNGYGLDTSAHWSSDESDREQGHVTYTADQVTHWMPMPGEPK